MGHRRSNDDEVLPDQFSAKDLWRVCNKYGTVIDAFIPNRRSKSGKVFWIRAKEVPGWIPDFVEEEEEDNDSDSDPKDDELETDIVDKQKYANEGGDSDVKESFLNYLW
ncbi:hypothetical protein Tco_1562930 [Tanacetum coccineum]